jgi:hypothetical protein
MGDAQTASTLTYVAAILQIIFSLIALILGFLVVGLLFLPFMYDPYFLPLMGIFILLPLILFGVFGVVGLVFGLLWLNWRHYPSEHKTGLIVSGVLSLIFSSGYIPGILTIIAGAIAPSPSAYQGYAPVKPPIAPPRTRCPHCGANVTRQDRFCWRCGAQL